MFSNTLSKTLSSWPWSRLSSRHSRRHSATVYSTDIGAKTAGSEDWYKSISGHQLCICPLAHVHISMNRLQMNIDYASLNDPLEACDELHISPCVCSTVSSRFHLLLIQRPDSQAWDHKYDVFPWAHQTTYTAKIDNHTLQHCASQGARLEYSSPITSYGTLDLAYATLYPTSYISRGGLEYSAQG